MIPGEAIKLAGDALIKLITFLSDPKRKLGAALAELYSALRNCNARYKECCNEPTSQNLLKWSDALNALMYAYRRMSTALEIFEPNAYNGVRAWLTGVHNPFYSDVIAMAYYVETGEAFLTDPGAMPDDHHVADNIRKFQTMSRPQIKKAIEEERQRMNSILRNSYSAFDETFVAAENALQDVIRRRFSMEEILGPLSI